MKIAELENKRILIMGYGMEGKATEEFLRAKVPSAVIGIADRHDDPDYLSKQDSYDLVIKTPSLHKSKLHVPYTTATNIFFANVKNMIIGITGSKGKSTTTSLIYSILKEAGMKATIKGNIGIPMISELLRPIDEDEVFVLELSSYQLDDIHYSPHIAVVTSLFPEHMNFHGSIEAYYEAKHQIIRYQTEADMFVYNQKFDLLCEWAKQSRSMSVPYIEDDISDWERVLKGEHNLDNIHAAVTVARQMNISDEISERAVAKFEPLAHRLEYAGTYKGIQFINDALATTPEATMQALRAYPDVTTIMLGGEDRGYDFSDLVDMLGTTNIQTIIIFPESGQTMMRMIKEKYGERYSFFETTSMEDAVKHAYEQTKQGATCLLSTASPSYSIWKNYVEKGNLFKEYVLRYGGEV